jgi:hypothetical protein
MSDNEKTVVKGCSFSGVTEESNMIQVDVKDGKIIRIRPGRSKPGVRPLPPA